MTALAIPPYWVYTRLDAHVGWDDDRLMAELDEWAERALKKGAAGLTDGLRQEIRREHARAQDLYRAVTTGDFSNPTKE
jgi:hypothetical protein